ncbi:MAG: FKBP-type peptidyl-prolyl cis-trans isomerase [Planctomycetota bacterium]
MLSFCVRSATALLLASPALATVDPSWGTHVEWTEEGPVAREHASVMAFGDTVVVYAGSGYEPQLQPLADAWAYDVATRSWTELELAGDIPTPGGSKRVAQEPGADHAYLFAGYGEGFAINNDLHLAKLDGETLRFERLEQDNAPPARALHAFGFDPKERRFVAALGIDPQTGFLADTWTGTFDETGAVRWTQVEAAPTEGRFGFAFGFDTETGQLVTHSGQVPSQTEPLATTQALWVLDTRAVPPVWTGFEAPPVGRRNPNFAFDDEHDRLVIWCGTADARTNVPGLVTIERTPAGSWVVREHDDDEAPPRRSSGFGFAHPSNDSVLLGFGNSAEGRYTDWVTIYFSKEITTKSGLRYRVIEPGDGPVAEWGMSVTLHESTSLEDGTPIFSTWDSGQPIGFPLGADRVIDGLEELVTGMRVGEVREAVMPPAITKRQRYPETFGPEDTLVFRVELVDIGPGPDEFVPTPKPWED